MPGFPVQQIKFREDDNNGFPLAGGKLWSYAAGTSTPLATYTDASLSTPNTNPVVLDAAGRWPMFVHDGVGYKFVMMDALGNTIYTIDNWMVPQIAAAAVPSATPIGGVIMFAGSVAPTGWLLCDGSSVSQATYPDLFNAIGTTYGGSGAAFNIPDCRQRFVLGKTTSGTGSSLNEKGGQIDHRHSGPSHHHVIDSHTHTFAHVHTVPRDGWGSVINTPPIDGRLQSGNAGGFGPDASNWQPIHDNTTTVGTTSPGATDANTVALQTKDEGTEDTGNQNPAYITLNYIIKALP